MENLFDFLEDKEEKQDKNTTKEIKYIVDEEHLKHLEKVKISLYNEDEIKASGLDRSDYIRLNSYVGSRLNTDLRAKNNTIKEETKIQEIKENYLNLLEEVQIDEDIFNEENNIIENKLLVVDGSSLLSTSFYATARDLLFAKTEEQKEFAYTKLMKSPDGEYTNGIYMFFKTLLPLLESQKVTHLAVVLDRSRNTFRREIDPEYKANRSETPYPLKSQFKLLTELLEEINIPVFSHTEYEADDFAGSLVKKFEKDIPIYLHTKDEDYIQLVSEYTKLWMVTGKAEDMYKEIGVDKKTVNVPSGIFEYTPEYVKYFKGIDPIQIIDAKAIEGDKSDNIKGVKGVGPTSSRPLISHYGSIEEIYKNIENLSKDEEKELLTFFKDSLGIKRSPLKNLLLYKEDAIISKKLATIKTDIEEVQNMKLDNLVLNIDNEKMHKVFMDLGMVSLVK
ncbi:MAG: 5'-3' exonuclease [Romboutsia sp.]|nr:5'-3' exonuclease [Romboutsia sp.]